MVVTVMANAGILRILQGAKSSLDGPQCSPRASELYKWVTFSDALAKKRDTSSVNVAVHSLLTWLKPEKTCKILVKYEKIWENVRKPEKL